jgi:hypothetical protein
MRAAEHESWRPSTAAVTSFEFSALTVLSAASAARAAKLSFGMKSCRPNDTQMSAKAEHIWVFTSCTMRKIG